MKNKKSLLLRLFLLFIAAVAVSSMLNQGPKNVFGNYFESGNFLHEQEEYIGNLNKYVLNPLNKEELLAQIDVTKKEIEHYRNYYGTLSEQIANIEEQYAEQVAGNENAAADSAYIAAIKLERDAKITEVKKNFEDDAVVTEKIRAIKEKALNRFLVNYESERKSFINSSSNYGYSLTNQETDVTIESDEDKGAHLFTEKVTISFGSKGRDRATETIYFDDTEYEAGIMDSSIMISYPDAAYKGEIYIPKSALKNASFEHDYNVFTMAKILFLALWALGITAIILLFTKFKLTRAHFEGFDKFEVKVKNWPLDVHIAVTVIIGFFTIEAFESMAYIVSAIPHYTMNYRIWDIVEKVIEGAFNFALLGVTIFLGIWLFDRLTDPKVEQQLKGMYMARFSAATAEVFLNRSIGKQTFAMLIVFYLGGFGLMVGFQGAEYFAFYVFLFTFILIPTLYVFLRRMGYLNKIMKQTADMAEGRLTSGIEIRGKSPLAEHAKNLNALQNGVRKSVTEQAKSERLKTELITNVSHDLRTPLTSIITYTDLLKNPDLTPEEHAKYVEILDRKADRLKVLIEDLFEVSKMTSGNVELLKQKVDIAQLLQQITGERKEDFTAAGLDLRVSIQNQPLFASVDGQKLWRVLDNLMNNTLNYSLIGTRVYATLSEQNGVAKITMKNVSKYELAEDTMELSERFKRADLARHTEGSGLGLAIAQSIIELHGGKMEIEADGDLFKVTISLPCM